MAPGLADRPDSTPTSDKLADKSAPMEHFYLQRTMPGQELDLREFTRVMDLAADGAVPTRNTDLPWKQEGPLNIGGRLNCIAIHPDNPDIWYTGASTGGIFRTLDAGETWTPIADDFDYLSIADIVFDPTDSDVMYAATGDPNISGMPHPGNGIYKSTDGGNSWTHLGLEEGVIITKIVINPADPDIIFAGAMGLPFAPTTARGVYRSSNGGATWNLVHFIDDQTGIIDMVSHPANPNVIYAASWTRVRNNQESIITGENCRIWRSSDNGDNWEMLTDGLPDGELCRIGLTMSNSDPDKLYAIVISTSFQIEGIYRTSDGGDSWGPVDWDIDQMANAMGGFGWYFGKIHVNPEDDSQISVLGVDLWTTDNSGNDWYMSCPIWWEYLVHADKHDMETLPDGSILLATDGGLYRHPGGMNNTNIYAWEDVDEIPNTQFYHVGLNPFDPNNYTGGAQDNGTTTGNQEAWSAWTRDFGGDGFQAYYDSNAVGLRYVAVQNGALYFLDANGWGEWEDFTYGLDEEDRRNWDMPYIPSPHTGETFYTGTYRMYKMTGAPYGIWQPISDDLTDGVIFGDRYHTISTVAESPVQAGLLYAGTTDANVWRSLDDGASWDNVTSGLPERYVTNIKASPEDAQTVFVTHSGYKDNDNTAYIHKSTDAGDTWTAVPGDLPDLPINHLEVWNDTTLFIATDVGVYFTENGGGNWQRVGNNMPLIPVFDLEFNVPNMELVAATFSRSMMTFPLDSLIPEPVVDPVGINELALQLNVYPNPTANGVWIEGLEQPGLLRVFNATGQVVLQRQLNGRSFVQLAHLPSGTYHLLLQQGDRVRRTQVVRTGQ